MSGGAVMKSILSGVLVGTVVFSLSSFALSEDNEIEVIESAIEKPVSNIKRSAGLQEKDAEIEKLEQTQAELGKSIGAAEAQANLAAKNLRENKEKAAAIENEIRKMRQKLQDLEDQVKIVEADSKAEDALMAERQDRLRDLTSRAKAMEAESVQRQAAMDEKAKSRERKEVKLKIERVERSQIVQRELAGTQPAVTLQLVRKAPRRK